LKYVELDSFLFAIFIAHDNALTLILPAKRCSKYWNALIVVNKIVCIAAIQIIANQFCIAGFFAVSSEILACCLILSGTTTEIHFSLALIHAKSLLPLN
jgi:hypothetical protein